MKFFVKNSWIQDGRFKDGCHHQVESEWMSEVFFVQNGWIQDDRIQDGCHHQVRWEWMSFSQIELCWVRVRLEWECFWVNVRGDKKVSESKMAVSECNIAEFQNGYHHQVESKWMSEVFLCANGGNQSWQVWESLRVNTKIAESKMAEFKMATIIKIGENKWVWVRLN